MSCHRPGPLPLRLSEATCPRYAGLSAESRGHSPTSRDPCGPGSRASWDPPFRFPIPADPSPALSGVRGKSLQTGFLVAYRGPRGFISVPGDVGFNASRHASPASHPGKLLFACLDCPIRWQPGSS